jgi:hypothetical protein
VFAKGNQFLFLFLDKCVHKYILHYILLCSILSVMCYNPISANTRRIFNLFSAICFSLFVMWYKLVQ